MVMDRFLRGGPCLPGLQVNRRHPQVSYIGPAHFAVPITASYKHGRGANEDHSPCHDFQSV